jgi:UPF0176 protein
MNSPESSPQSYIVATFYKFVALPDYESWRDPLLQFCADREIKGTILLAAEGINATIAGSREAIDAVFAYLQQNPELMDLTQRESVASSPPFERMKVKLKPEIVTLGMPDVDPTQQVGQYVDPQVWNILLKDPRVTVIDTRNDYEFQIGTFQGALNPQTQSFREFPDYVKTHLNPQQHPKVALFCTGGIRCEKATALMLQWGFQEVYHLQGGILNYLASIAPQDSLWEGECFVFDDRVALQDGLERGHYQLCPACGNPMLRSEDPRSRCSICRESHVESSIETNPDPSPEAETNPPVL